MNREALRAETLDILQEIVPDLEPERLDSKASFRDQFEIDSIDYLNFVLTLEKKLGITIPEVDYPRLSSLDGCLAYLEAKTGG
ncbi:acyl carrier protein [Thioalbus denitrificans]|uniref:Acyl carrier protein n=1 Tax=Thioalbus denitrificans TaxID=547122 RepID=A0A369BQJ1_9GAMM|nr:acyl carrier protein [Thioalbus denitrificans]RCX23889.1 acyl carrier protein [Thioalbus denitrificans]